MIYFKYLSKTVRGGLIAGSLLLLGCNNGFFGGKDGPVVHTPETAFMSSFSGAVAAIESPHYLLEKKAPESVTLGGTFEYLYTLIPRTALKEVVIEDRVPEGASLQATVPEAKVDGKVFRWVLPSVQAQQPITLRAKVRAEEPILLENCVTISVQPAACSCVMVTQPVLEIQKSCCASCANVGDRIKFDIKVSNTGNCPAENVIVRDLIPEGLAHSSKNSVVEMPLGTLMPGDCKVVPLCLEVLTPGEWCNVAKVFISGREVGQAKACLSCRKMSIAVQKVGPEHQLIGGDAEYSITVTNDGTELLRDINVTDVLPEGTKLISSNPEGALHGHHLHWVIDVLEPGAEKVFKVVLCGSCQGRTCNTVSVCSGELRAEDRVCTDWEGRPNLSATLEANCDSLLVGEESCFTIYVNNEGNAAAQEISVQATFNDMLSPQSASGPSTAVIDGQAISFAHIQNIQPGQTLKYRVLGRAKALGKGTLTVLIKSKTLGEPITEVQSIQVY